MTYLMNMKSLIVSSLTFMALNYAQATVYIIRKPDAEADPFRNKVTGTAVVRKEVGSELVFVPIRGCGKITLFRNAKGDLPQEGDRIEYAFDGRCKISDWRK